MSLKDDLRNNKYLILVPEYLRENENFLIYFSFLIHEFNITNENIRTFTDLINPDKVPIGFIEALGSYMNYSYLPNASDDFNREVLMRMRTIWEMRGSKHSIIMAATHGSNPGWVGGDIFIPDYPISKNIAELYVPREYIFRHSVSLHSGNHYFPSSGFYELGVLCLRLSYLDEDVKQKIYRNTPAGLKYVFEIISDLVNEDGTFLSLNDYLKVWPKNYEESLTDDTNLAFLYEINLGIFDEESQALIHSKNRKLHSGAFGASLQSTILDSELDIQLGSSMLPINALSVPFLIRGSSLTEILEAGEDVLIHDMSTRDSKRFQSRELLTVREIEADSNYIISDTGEYLDRLERNTSEHLYRDLTYSQGEFLIYNEPTTLGDIYIEFEGERDILPDDSTYNVLYVGDLRPNDLRDNFFNNDFDVEDIEYYSRAYDVLNAPVTEPGDVPMYFYGEKLITPHDGYDVSYVGDLKDGDLRDNFYQTEFDVDNETYSVSDRIDEIINAPIS